MGTRSRTAVLGGLGFIGSHLARRLLEDGDEVVVFDKLYASRALVSGFEGDLRIVEGDLARTESVLEAIRNCDTVYNLIHTTVPVTSMQDPVYDITTNVAATVRWMSRLNETRVETVVYVSSGGTVYGPPRSLPVTEDHPTEPHSSYGITKLAIEKYTALLTALTGRTCRIARLANAYGPGQRTTASQGIVAIALERILAGKPVDVWGDGSVSRDYVHVADLARALALLGRYQGPETIFNVGTGTATSVREILSLLGAITGLEVRIRPHPARPHDLPANALDASRLERETGWRPSIALPDGLKELVEHARSARPG